MTATKRPELDGTVREHIALELGNNARRVLEFLDQAKQILSGPAVGRRGPETVAYCLRESLDSIVKTVPKGDLSQRNAVVRAVVRERDKYDKATPGPAQELALRALLVEIDKLRDLERLERFDEHRLTQFIRQRTGQEALSLRDDAPKQYRSIVRRLNSALHEETTIQEVEGLWNEVVALPNRLFTPPAIRRAELAEFARRKSPTSKEAAEARHHILTPAHLTHFLRNVADPRWLRHLANEKMIGLTGDASWTVHTVGGTVGKGHPKAVASWFCEIYESSSKSNIEALTVAQAATDLGSDAVPLLSLVMREHSDSHWLPLFINIVLPEIPPEHAFVEDVASALLARLAEPGASFSVAADRRYFLLRDIIRHLVNGTEAPTAMRRYRLLCQLLERVSVDDFVVRQVANEGDSLSAADAADLEAFDYPLEMLVGAWVQVSRRAREWVGGDDLLVGVGAVPAVLRQRLRAWLLIHGLGGREHLAIEHIADGIRERWPNRDDLRLVEGIKDRGHADAAGPVWTSAMGAAPDIPTLSAALQEESPAVVWARAREWASALPDEVTRGWHNAIAVMDNHYGESVTESGVRSARTSAAFVGSPMDREELMTLDPLEASCRIAAWRPKTDQVDVNARALGQTLEEVIVTSEDDRWTGSPVRIACALRHPTYIAHYVAGLTKVLRERALPVASSELVDVVRLVQDAPWRVVALGQPDFDFDADWEWTRDASIDLLKMMARSDTGFSGREEEAWAILERHVRSPGEPEEFYGDDAQWLVSTAINWRRTRALEAAIAFVAWERRAGGGMRKEARNLLAYTIEREGRVGVLCRAIIACILHVIDHVCPGWLADNMSYLFEDESPGNMSAKTLELALSWARPPALRRVLGAYPQRVEEASMAGVGNAFVRYVGAMIYSVRGYTPGGVFECVRKNEALVKSVGSILRELLGPEAEEAVVKSVVEFWRQAIHNGPKVMLPQFGWLALVDRIDDEIWTTHMLETLLKTGGRVAGDIKKYVAERAAGLRPSREALRIMDHLVRESTRFDDVLVFPEARKMMEKSRDLYGLDEYRRVEAALAERGAQE